MYEGVECVALRTIKYDDRRAIVTAWSRQMGRVSFIVPWGGGREAARRRALMMPMSLFAGEASVRPGQELMSIRDVRPLKVLTGLSADPAKALVALLLSEVTERVLRDMPPDEALTEFVFNAVERLDAARSARAVASFAHVFLYKLSHFVGIAPDMSGWRRGRCFDMSDGIFRDTLPGHTHYLEPVAARGLWLLSRLDFDNIERLGLPRLMRREMLDRILEYYTLHHTRLTDLKALEVAQEVF